MNFDWRSLFRRRGHPTLGSILRRALRGSLTQGWVYLPDEGPWTASTRCLLLDDDAMDCSAEELEEKIARAGFPVEGLDTDTIESVARGAATFDAAPSDALLVEAFTYYHRFDAFFPAPSAPDPPPWAETLQRLDREFYDSLGDERPDTVCGEDGCGRGAIEHSTRCRRHHFEMVKGRAWTRE
jgi:hypothetical protein